MSESNQKNALAVANEIAKKLGETAKKPRRQINSIVKLCGVDFAEKILEETLTIEANGGMTTQDGSRRRTIGGVYFYVARQQMTEEVEQEIFFTWRFKTKRREAREARFPEFDWKQRPEILQQLFENAGKVSEVKVNLVGRPEEVERRQNLVILTMQDHIEEMVFPSGVPQPSSNAVNYAVYISAKQWERVEEAIKAPDDELVIDGMVAYDADTSAMAVFTTYVTTRKLILKDKKQQKNAAKQAQKKAAKTPKRPGKNDRPARNAHQPNDTRAKSHDTAVEEKPADPEVNIDLPPGIPSQAAQKLVDLHKAAATFRQKIAMLEEKPADQQFGLEMTQKLLKNTESQIVKLEKQYAKDS